MIRICKNCGKHEVISRWLCRPCYKKMEYLGRLNEFPNMPIPRRKPRKTDQSLPDSNVDNLYRLDSAKREMQHKLTMRRHHYGPIHKRVILTREINRLRDFIEQNKHLLEETA